MGSRRQVVADVRTGERLCSDRAASRQRLKLNDADEIALNQVNRRRERHRVASVDGIEWPTRGHEGKCRNGVERLAKEHDLERIRATGAPGDGRGVDGSIRRGTAAEVYVGDRPTVRDGRGAALIDDLCS